GAMGKDIQLARRIRGERA
nr:Chain B, Histone H3 [Homo sapiens]